MQQLSYLTTPNWKMQWLVYVFAVSTSAKDQYFLSMLKKIPLMKHKRYSLL